jgi:ATP-binding cassette subfamily B protein
MKYKIGLLVAVILGVISAVLEVVTIGAVFPLFVGILGEGNTTLINNELFAHYITLFPQNTPLVLTLIVGFSILTILTMIWRIFTIGYTAKFAYSFGHHISKAVYKNILDLEYKTLVSMNSGNIISSITIKVNNVIQNLLFPLMMLFIAIIALSIFITAFVFFSNNAPVIFYIGGSIMFLYVLIIVFFKNFLKRNSVLISENQTLQTKHIQNTFGNLRDIILRNEKKIFENKFNNIDYNIRKKQAENIVIGQSPRYIIEGFGVIVLLLSVYLYSLNTKQEIITLLPFIGMLAIAFQRVLPYVNQAYRSWANIMGNLHALSDIKSLLEPRPVEKVLSEKGEALDFFHHIEFKNVNFSLKEKNILKEVNVKVYKNEKVGVIGPSGGGKSTFLDLLMGLLEPSEGKILVDGVNVVASNREAWFRNISHVPQDIFIFDSDINFNITLAEHQKIHLRRLNQAKNAAFIDNSFSERALVGERGSLLSGGQKQRIGLARAYYQETPLLILDEATSALDNQTEANVINSLLSSMQLKTIVSVTHKPSSLRGFDRILFVNNGAVVEVESVENALEIMGKMEGDHYA